MKHFSVDKKISPRNAAICMMGCAFLWSTSGALIKLIEWNGMVITCLRSAVAAVALYIYLLLLGKKLVLNRLTMTTAIAVCIKYVCFIVGNKLTSSANMVALQYTNPVFVLVISIFIFHKKVKNKDVLVAIATAAGIAMLTLDRTGPSSTAGNLMGLAVGFTTAIMYLMAARSTSYEESLSIITLGHIYTAVIMSPFLLFSKITFTPQNVSSILLLGLLQQAVAYALFSFATRSAPPLTCCLIACINPLFNPVWTAVLVHEIPGPITITGFIIVLGSITLWSVSNAKDKTKALTEKDASSGC
ncbi:MAG: family transporter [Oscillospiraceae bacterium]|jgi:drug/metabolite transporter (DMT)-like permease|nr:family transporter [Oscillospiraceae bacterium]